VRIGSSGLFRFILAFILALAAAVAGLAGSASSAGGWRWSIVLDALDARNFLLFVGLRSSRVLAWLGALVRYVSLHTGVPALLVAAVLVCVGYRVLKRTARFAIEVAAVALALVAASELGWIRW
jgi:hypothetical protein